MREQKLQKTQNKNYKNPGTKVKKTSRNKNYKKLGTKITKIREQYKNA
jgi:hypothetical protein